MIVLAHIIVTVVLLLILAAAAVILYNMGWKKISDVLISLVSPILILVMGIGIWWAIDTVLLYYGVMS